MSFAEAYDQHEEIYRIPLHGSNEVSPGKELLAETATPSHDVVAPRSGGTHMRFSLDILTRAAREVRSQLPRDEGPSTEEMRELRELCQQLQSLTMRFDATSLFESDATMGGAASSMDRAVSADTNTTELEAVDACSETGEVSPRTLPDQNSAQDDVLDCTEWRRQELVKVFKQIDSDGSGRISARELCKAMQAVQIPRARSAKLIRLADVDDSGDIDLKEWIHVVETCIDRDLEELHERCSRDGSEGALSSIKEELATRCMLHPISPKRLSWDLLMGLICVYLAITQPFYVAFESKLRDETVATLSFVDRVLDVVFAIDILINFRTGYITYGTHVASTSVDMNPRRIALNYARTWLAFDVVSAMPFSLFVPNSVTDVQAAKMLKMYKFLRLFKLVKGLPIFYHLEQYEWFETVNRCLFVRFLRRRGLIFLMMIFLCHMMACVMKLVYDGSLTAQATKSWEYDEASVQREYIAAFYWCMTTLTTVGYGDIIPISDGERVFAVVAMVIGGGFYGIVVGTINAMVTEHDLNASAFYNRMELIYAWTLHHQLPRQTRTTVCRYFRHFLAQRSAINEADVWEDLSPELQKEVGTYIVHEDVRYNPIFDNVSVSAVVKLQSILHKRTVFAHRTIVKFGDAGTTMYIISGGLVEQDFQPPRSRKGRRKASFRKPSRVLHPGHSFGEEAVLGFLEEYEYSAITVEDTELETILKDQLMQIFQAMPHVLQRMKQNALQMNPRLQDHGGLQQEAGSSRYRPKPKISRLVS